MQETPARELSMKPVIWRSRVCWMTHRVPFQRSASVVKTAIRRPNEEPTAVQAVAETHDTPDSELTLAAARSGVRRMTHFLPFQRSASGSLPASLIRSFPTAMPPVADQQDTPVSSPVSEPRLGVGWIAHFLPFQYRDPGRRQATAFPCAAARALRR